MLDINDPDARLYLLDNKETTTGSADESALEYEGVPDGEIHVRSDVLVFRKGFEGSWLRVGDDRRAQEVIVGHQRTNTRWVKLKEHLGSEDHPVEFIEALLLLMKIILLKDLLTSFLQTVMLIKLIQLTMFLDQM